MGDTSGREWTADRFARLGRIRQESVDYAKARGAAYFVCDCDNFVESGALAKLMAVRHAGVVAPFMRTKDRMYSNFHFKVDKDGYYCGASTPQYTEVWAMKFKGLIECAVVHCAYLISHEFLDRVVYVDGTGRYEYVIFSDALRKAGVPQYLDNRRVYGAITFAETEGDLAAELPYIRPLILP